MPVIISTPFTVRPQGFYFDSGIGGYSYSNGNRTATRTTDASWASTLLNTAFTKSSGAWYLEIQYTAFVGSFAGFVGQTVAGTTGSYLGSTANDWAYQGSDAGGSPSSSGRKWNNASPTNFGTQWETPTHLLMIASDLDTGDVWYGLDGVWNGDPSTATSPAFSGVTAAGTRWGISTFDAGESFTIPTAVTYPVPSGFTILS